MIFRRWKFMWIITSSLVLLISFFNSCEGKLTTKSTLQSTCINNKNQLSQSKLNLDALPTNAVFKDKKVHLTHNENSKGLSKKVANEFILSAGTQLLALIDNKCLFDGDKNNDFSLKIVGSQNQIEGFKTQTYPFSLENDTDISEIESLSNGDHCIIGLGYNKTYKSQATFNDPGAFYQKHLQAINHGESLDDFFNNSWGINSGIVGSEVVVAVIDTGVDYNHPDLESRMWRHKDGVGLDASTLGSGLIDFNPMDTSSISHGTHVAGLIAAEGNNGIGTIGIDPFNVKIMAIRVFYKNGSNYETNSDIVSKAIQFASLNGAEVINLSLGRLFEGPDSDVFYKNAIQNAINDNVFVVSAIGNSTNAIQVQEVDGVNLSSLPAMYGQELEGMITVGSIYSSNNEWSTFSHYSNKYVEIAAPGAETSSTGLYSTTTPVPFNQNQIYSRLSGTSMSAPLVSGAAALTIGLIKKGLKRSPTPREVEELIIESAISEPKLMNYFKNGKRLDLKSLIDHILIAHPEIGSNLDASRTFNELECN